MTVRTYTVGSSSTSSPYYEFLKQDGVNTPKRLRKIGKWTNNPYEMERYSMINPRMSSVWYTKSGKARTNGSGINYLGQYLGYFMATSWSTAKSTSLLTSKLANEWRNSPINLGMYLSPEGRESVEMVSSSLMKIVRSTNALRKGNFGGFLKELRPIPRSHKRRSYKRFTQGDLSGSFLAAHLGWEPLIKDAYAASNIEPPTYMSASIKAKLGDNPGKVTCSNAGLYLINPKSFGVQKLTATVRRAPTFSERFGMDNPFAIAWELVPLSFVADYFLPIGATIDSMAFISKLAVTDVTLSRYQEISYTLIAPPNSVGWTSGGATFYDRASHTYVWRARKFKRSPYVLNLGDALDWKVSLPKSITRLATISALVHQSILRLKKT